MYAAFFSAQQYNQTGCVYYLDANGNKVCCTDVMTVPNTDTIPVPRGNGWPDIRFVGFVTEYSHADEKWTAICDAQLRKVHSHYFP